MAVILRIDVDSSYGKKNLLNHLFSRLTSDFDIPPIFKLPYLEYLSYFIKYLNNKSIPGYFFFRKCTLPTKDLLNELKVGGHIIGLHLENSRSLDTFKKEIERIENSINSKVEVFSKHGSGSHKYGYYHYPSYEPEKYLKWGSHLGMKTFLGNLEDPTIASLYTNEGLLFFPSAFWLEPHWRDIKSFDLNWLIQESKIRDTVLLIHVENLLINKVYWNDLELIIQNTQIKIL
jgi:hypothetical protein